MLSTQRVQKQADHVNLVRPRPYLVYQKVVDADVVHVVPHREAFHPAKRLAEEHGLLVVPILGSVLHEHPPWFFIHHQQQQQQQQQQLEDKMRSLSYYTRDSRFDWLGENLFVVDELKPPTEAGTTGPYLVQPRAVPGDLAVHVENHLAHAAV